MDFDPAGSHGLEYQARANPNVIADRAIAVDSAPFEDFRSVMAKTCAPQLAPNRLSHGYLRFSRSSRLDGSLCSGTYLLPVHRRFAPLFSPIQADGAFSAY